MTVDAGWVSVAVAVATVSVVVESVTIKVVLWVLERTLV
jgi:hypothetical protein